MNNVQNIPAAPVLYVEDDENDVFFMEMAFARAGLRHPLQIARDGKRGLDYLAGNGQYADRARYPLPGLVLLDLNLPVCSGFEILRWLRLQPRFHALPVLVFTASTQQSDSEKAQQLGANEFITKPTNLNQLPELLKDLIDRWPVLQ
jgi:CheY-like chemotaxis protein